jgi:predicted kinase
MAASRAAELLSMGESVIACATWISAEQRAAAAAMAESVAADMVQLQCTAPAALTARRMSSRKDIVSDADPGGGSENGGRAGTIAEGHHPRTSESASRERASWPAELVQRALEAIRPHGPEHPWRSVQPYMPPD